MYFRKLQNYTGDFLLANPVAKLIHNSKEGVSVLVQNIWTPTAKSIFKCKEWEGDSTVMGQRELNSVCAVARRRDAEGPCCSLLCPQFWLATSVSSLLFLLEQNKEVHVLFWSCEMECLLSGWLHAVHWGEVASHLYKRPQVSFEI